jgi:hypothetical protein
MSMQSARTIQELHTTLPPDEVLARAHEFFTRRNNLYATFIDREGPAFATFRGQGGEEIAIGVAPAPAGGTLVTGSTYLFDMQVARFLVTLPPAPGSTGVAAPAALPEAGE